MIQRTHQQRSQYELRLKAQRDENARLQHAQAEGEARGEARGKLMGQIETLANYLGEPVVSFENLGIDELASIADDLQRQLRQRGV